MKLLGCEQSMMDYELKIRLTELTVKGFSSVSLHYLGSINHRFARPRLRAIDSHEDQTLQVFSLSSLKTLSETSVSMHHIFQGGNVEAW